MNERTLRPVRWNRQYEWLRAQRDAATTHFTGYRQHTPESIYLCRKGDIMGSVEWSLPMEINYERGQR